MGLRKFFNKLLGRYDEPERAKKTQKEPGVIMTSDGKDPRYNKQGKICNQRGAFGRAKIC